MSLAIVAAGTTDGVAFTSKEGAAANRPEIVIEATGAGNGGNSIVDGAVRFTVLRDGLIRAEYARDGQFLDAPSFIAIDRTASNESFSSDISNGWRRVVTARGTVRYRRGSGRFSADNLVIETNSGGRSISAVPRFVGNTCYMGQTCEAEDGVSVAGSAGPILRLHSDHGDRLPWEYGDAAAQPAAAFLRLREALLPYTYTAARQAMTTGVGMTRPLWLEYPHDAPSYQKPSQYLFGDALLVASVTELAWGACRPKCICLRGAGSVSSRAACRRKPGKAREP